MASAVVKPWADRHGIDLNVAYCAAETIRTPRDFSDPGYWDEWAYQKLMEQFPDAQQREQIRDELRQELRQRGTII